MHRRIQYDPSRYPKVRTELPTQFQRVYEHHYHLNRRGGTIATSMSKRMESWLHRKVADDVCQQTGPASTLELGAGTLNQLAYEPILGPYDIVEPFSSLFESSPALHRVRAIFRDIQDVPLEQSYDRITSIATF